jgi:hypothetical protein
MAKTSSKNQKNNASPLLNNSVDKFETKVEALTPNPEVIAHDPGQKKVYSYDPVTKEYNGTTIAFECPIERGVFNMPANTTDVEPLKDNGEDLIVFNSKGWDYKKV